MRYPQIIEKLMHLLQKLPGVGRRTSERYAFDFLLEWKEKDLKEFQLYLSQLQTEIKSCSVCGCLLDKEKCLFCNDSNRNEELLCVVSTPREVFSIENTREYRGLYHVLGGLLSPLDDKNEESILLDKLKTRLASSRVKEVIIALDSTLEGDATSLYIKEELEGVKVTRLAFGIPVGSSLEYVDGGSLARSFVGRVSF